MDASELLELELKIEELSLPSRDRPWALRRLACESLKQGLAGMMGFGMEGDLGSGEFTDRWELGHKTCMTLELKTCESFFSYNLLLFDKETQSILKTKH